MFDSVTTVDRVADQIEVVCTTHVRYALSSSFVQLWIHVNYDKRKELHEADVVSE